MIASNFYTAEAQKFFSAIRRDADKGQMFTRAVREVASRGDIPPCNADVGAVLAAGIVHALGPFMENAPPLLSAIVAHVIATEIRWDEIAPMFTVDESSN